MEASLNQMKRTVLVVEDNEINRDILQEILSDNYNVIEAEDGRKGFQLLQENYKRLSLVLLDIHLPYMNGFEFLEKYSADKMLTAVPIIVMTGSTAQEDEERCLELGASDFITKPFNPSIVLHRAEAIIRLTESTSLLQNVEFDDVTDVYTRYAFTHYAAQRLIANPDVQYNMLLVNVEDFSYLNRREGEQKCDELLKHIGKKMQNPLNEKNGAEGKEYLVCRYTADRFFCFWRGENDDIEKSVAIFDKYVHENAPIDNFVLKYAIYIGIDHNQSVSRLCDSLNETMAAIKNQYGERIVRYSSANGDASLRRRRIADTMEEALREKQFSVYYQPKHAPATGKLCGAEALVRWIHPTYGFMSPGDFIPLFEENGFISYLDDYIWHRVIEDQAEWAKQGIPIVPVSINVSRRDFKPDWDIAKLAEDVRKAGIETEKIHIEVTESIFNGNNLVLPMIARIREMGFKVELDDFGSGYSALGMLVDIPMDIVKLDMSFIRALEKQYRVVDMIINLSHALGLKVVAEGAEEQEQVNTLLSLGCDYIQGYFYSKPLPHDQFEAYLKEKA